jgi:hypothetical protein
MRKIYLFIGRFKPEDEFIWSEYIRFLQFEERLLERKLAMVKSGAAEGKNFTVSTEKEAEERARICMAMCDSLVKQTYSLMQLGWQNDK